MNEWWLVMIAVQLKFSLRQSTSDPSIHLCKIFEFIWRSYSQNADRVLCQNRLVVKDTLTWHKWGWNRPFPKHLNSVNGCIRLSLRNGASLSLAASEPYRWRPCAVSGLTISAAVEYIAICSHIIVTTVFMADLEDEHLDEVKHRAQTDTLGMLSR